MKNLNLQSLIIIAVLALVTILWGIGSVPLFDPDEPVYAETAREMIKYNDYLSPRIFDNFWYDKPPMYYWLVAASIGLFGDGEAAARFPAALMAVATSVMLYFSVSNIFSERAGFWASIVLTTCVEFFYLGKAAVTDTTLLFFMTAALLCYQHKWYWVMYIAMALATVTKGPIGIVFPGAIIFLHLLFTGNLREILKMHVIRGLVVYFAIAAPWYYLMYQAHGMEFINTFLGFHNLTRFTTPEHPDRVLWWYYLPVIILGMFPWTGLLLQSIRASISEASSEELVKMSFFNIWWVFVLLFFSISQTKLVSYILPMFPALAIIIGWNLARLEKQRGESLLSWVIGTVIMFGLLGAGWLIGGNQLPEAFLEASVLSGTLRSLTTVSKDSCAGPDFSVVSSVSPDSAVSAFSSAAGTSVSVRSFVCVSILVCSSASSAKAVGAMLKHIQNTNRNASVFLTSFISFLLLFILGS